MSRFVWVLLFASSLFVTQARAQDVPVDCASFASAYRTGYSGGRSIARSAWSSRNVAQSCANIDVFRVAVTSALATRMRYELNLGGAPTQSAACRSLGFAQGATDTVDGLLNQCADTCFLEGQFIGEIAAVAYCELSIALGGLGLDELLLRGPVEVCGTAFEVGCDSNFQTRAVSYRNGDNIQCLPYTRVPFLEVFWQTQNNQCAYELEPEDP
jgi:hypothetical protein